MPVVMNEPETNPQWIRVPYDHSLPYLWARVVDQENGWCSKSCLWDTRFSSVTEQAILIPETDQEGHLGYCCLAHLQQVSPKPSLHYCPKTRLVSQGQQWPGQMS